MPERRDNRGRRKERTKDPSKNEATLASMTRRGVLRSLLNVSRHSLRSIHYEQGFSASPIRRVAVLPFEAEVTS